MKTMRNILSAAILLAVTFGSQADELNGNIKGTVDTHAIDVGVACSREKFGNMNWLMAYSEPLLHSRIEDRNGDGIGVSVSSNGEQAVFEVLVADQRYKFSTKKDLDLELTATGLEVQTTIKRYEGKGRDQKVVGEYEVDLKLDCP